MSKEKERKVLLTIDNIRIVEVDESNLILEKLETVVKKNTKTHEDRWMPKGYFRTIKAALRCVVNKEWLINKDELTDLTSYADQVNKSNEKILEAIGGI